MTAGAREELKALTTQGRVSARQQAHARILLPCGEGREDGGRTGCEIAEVLDAGVSTVARVRRRCVEEGLEAALNRKEPLNRRAKVVLDGEAEARLVAIACGEPPAGYARSVVVALPRESVDGVQDRGFREPGDGSSHA